MAAYVLIANGKWINTVEWDGVSDWPLPEGAVAIPFGDGVYGWDGKWTHDGVSYEQQFSVPVETQE